MSGRLRAALRVGLPDFFRLSNLSSLRWNLFVPDKLVIRCQVRVENLDQISQDRSALLTSNHIRRFHSRCGCTAKPRNMESVEVYESWILKVLNSY